MHPGEKNGIIGSTVIKKEEQAVKYKIGDVARILGISTDLLRYYEKKGVVTPEKDEHNDYRYYDFWDINFLMDCLWFKNFGFSIEQIADMVRIPSAQELVDRFEYREDQLRSTIKRCQLLLKRSEQYREEISRIPELLYKCEISRSREAVCYVNREGTEYPANAQLASLARQWLEFMPFNHRYFEIDAPALADGGLEDCRWGFSLGLEYAQELGCEPTPPVMKLESQKSIHTVFKSSGKGNFAPGKLTYAVDWAAANGYKINGPVRGVLVASVLEGDELSGYFEAWIPVEE